MTTGTYKFVSVIWNVAFVGAFIAGGFIPPAALVIMSVKTQFLDQIKIRLISQLINRISGSPPKVAYLF